MADEKREANVRYVKRDGLRTVLNTLFGRNNLIPSDFAEISAENVDHKFEQDSSGVRIAFTVSHHALGKVMTEEVAAALEVLER